MATTEPLKASFLPSIEVALRAVAAQGEDVSTADFAALMEGIMVVFDHLGPVLYFAKQVGRS